MNKFAELIIGTEKIKLPIKESKYNKKAVDVSKLDKRHGYYTYDPYLSSTAICSSSISYSDREKGELFYRGVPIEDLVKKHTFLEVAHLLLYGKLANHNEQKQFEYDINHHSLINEQMRNLFSAFSRHVHPMSIMMGALGCLAAFYDEDLDTNNSVERDLTITRIISKMPTIAAMTHKYSVNQPFVYPKNSLYFTENLLYMMFSTPCEEFSINPLITKVLDKIFILYADHGQNAPTLAIKTIGSCGANPFACISGGISSLWGNSYAGNNNFSVIQMLKKMNCPECIPKYITKAKSKKDPFKLMGFGNRIYNTYDPRAKILKKICKEVVPKINSENQYLLEIAIELETLVMQDEFFIEKNLYPNADLYSSILYDAIGIPPRMIPVLLSIARSVGWISHWKEMMEDEEKSVFLSRQLYID